MHILYIITNIIILAFDDFGCPHTLEQYVCQTALKLYTNIDIF